MDIKGSSIANDEGSMVGANGKVTKRATKAKKGTKKDLAKLETSRQQANIGISKKLQPKNKPPFFKLDQKVLRSDKKRIAFE